MTVANDHPVLLSVHTIDLALPLNNWEDKKIKDQQRGWAEIISTETLLIAQCSNPQSSSSFDNKKSQGWQVCVFFLVLLLAVLQKRDAALSLSECINSRSRRSFRDKKPKFSESKEFSGQENRNVRSPISNSHPPISSAFCTRRPFFLTSSQKPFPFFYWTLLYHSPQSSLRKL